MGDRDELGRFVKGNKASPGRKPRSVEEERMETFLDELTSEKWREITAKVIEMAIAGNLRAVELLTKYALGLPVQRAEVTLTTQPMSVDEWREIKDERVAKVEALDE